jgi:Ser/Thr protein kinase RdoA (MazF antagonist)
MKPYSKLTERGQARRLRRLAWKALEQYELEVIRLSLVTNDMNGIFRVDTRAGEKWILRITLPEGGHNPDHVESRLCTVFSWVRGTDLAEHLSPANIARLGKLMARLHAHALTYRPPAELSLLRFDRVFPFPEPVIFFDEYFSAFFPPERRAVYQQAIDWVQSAIDRLNAGGEPMRLLHGDLHQWNVRYFRGVLSPIDFEDLMWGWPVQDIATTLYYFLNSDTYPSMREGFQEGYTCYSSWPERYPGEIDAFIAARALGLANFILNDPNPSWKIQAVEFVELTESRLRWLMNGQK